MLIELGRAFWAGEFQKLLNKSAWRVRHRELQIRLPMPAVSAVGGAALRSGGESTGTDGGAPFLRFVSTIGAASRLARDGNERLSSCFPWLTIGTPNRLSLSRYACSVSQSDPRILGCRTLQQDQRYLATLLRPGMAVLDIGCGTGAITAGIAEVVGPQGCVVGVDRDAGLLELAGKQHGAVPNLRFEFGDATSLSFHSQFDIVTAARAPVDSRTAPGRSKYEEIGQTRRHRLGS